MYVNVQMRALRFKSFSQHNQYTHAAKYNKILKKLLANCITSFRGINPLSKTPFPPSLQLLCINVTLSPHSRLLIASLKKFISIFRFKLTISKFKNYFFNTSNFEKKIPLQIN
jgi:hypothetical protein